MLRTIPIRQYTTRQLDLDKIREIANNPELAEGQVFDFGKFVIARSGKNHNGTDITAEGQRAAVEKWIGKAILFEDHIMESDNQIGRIYESWIEEQDGETVTLGRGYGIITDDHQDLFARIKNRIHSELSCGYEPVRSLCSLCDNELDRTTYTCPQGHGEDTDGFFCKDVEFNPHHLSFTGNPAVEGAGLVAASRGAEPTENAPVSMKQEQQDRLQVLAKDGEVLRQWANREFVTWYKRNRPATPDSEIKSIANRLTAREMMQFANVEETRFRESIGSGKQVSETPTDDKPDEVVTYGDVNAIYKDRSKD